LFAYNPLVSRLYPGTLAVSGGAVINLQNVGKFWLIDWEAATEIGGWLATCNEIIEAHEGTIDKYLGDGFFAYWREDTITSP